MEVSVLGVAIGLELLIMIGGPIALMVYLRKRHGASLLLMVGGVIAWTGSQFVHIPLNAGLNAVLEPEWFPVASRPFVLAGLVGLTAGLCEEVARYLVFRFFARGRRLTFRDALAAGAGHGGFESVFFGVLVGAVWLHLFALSRIDPSHLDVTPEQTEQIRELIESLREGTAWAALAPAYERVASVAFHLSMSALVLVAVVRERPWVLGLAIALHALMDAVSTYLAGSEQLTVLYVVFGAIIPLAGAVMWACARDLRR